MCAGLLSYINQWLKPKSNMEALSKNLKIMEIREIQTRTSLLKVQWITFITFNH